MRRIFIILVAAAVGAGYGAARNDEYARVLEQQRCTAGVWQPGTIEYDMHCRKFIDVIVYGRTKMDNQDGYGTLDLITEAYTQVADGKARVDLDNGFGVVVKAYRCGTIIRIDVKEEQ